MIPLQTPPPTLWPGMTISSQDPDRFALALQQLEREDQWVKDFIERLRYAIEDRGRKD
jgi:hypothetical protein